MAFVNGTGTFRVPDPTTGQLSIIGVTIEEERIIRFLMDALVDKSAIGPVWVRCLPCGKRVSLTGNMRFNHDKWLEHRCRCQDAQDALKMIEKEGSFRPARPLAPILYADESADREEAAHERGVHSCRLPWLQHIAKFEVWRGRDPWVTSPPPSPSPSLSPSPFAAPSKTSFYHHPRYSQQQALEMEMEMEMRSGRDSLTLPPLQSNPPPPPVRLPSVRELGIAHFQCRK
ncbi:hypothetical protein V5O48_013800 [Marasmius crinis-equi]|uniref:Uncharacterized protein n=1 Tax=Marasmius crinis-equi TaxID=585013 RepID=A0ABR3EZ36_9AGAR